MPFNFKGTSISDINVIKNGTTTSLTELDMNGTKVWGKRSFTVNVSSMTGISSLNYSYVDAGGYTKTGTLTSTTTFSGIGYDQNITISATATTGYTVSGAGTFSPDGSTSTDISANKIQYTITVKCATSPRSTFVSIPSLEIDNQEITSDTQYTVEYGENVTVTHRGLWQNGSVFYGFMPDADEYESGDEGTYYAFSTGQTESSGDWWQRFFYLGYQTYEVIANHTIDIPTEGRFTRLHLGGDGGAGGWSLSKTARTTITNLTVKNLSTGKTIYTINSDSTLKAARNVMNDLNYWGLWYYDDGVHTPNKINGAMGKDTIYYDTTVSITVSATFAGNITGVGLNTSGKYAQKAEVSADREYVLTAPTISGAASKTITAGNSVSTELYNQDSSGAQVMYPGTYGNYTYRYSTVATFNGNSTEEPMLYATPGTYLATSKINWEATILNTTQQGRLSHFYINNSQSMYNSDSAITSAVNTGTAIYVTKTFDYMGWSNYEVKNCKLVVPESWRNNTYIHAGRNVTTQSYNTAAHENTTVTVFNDSSVAQYSKEHQLTAVTPLAISNSIYAAGGTDYPRTTIRTTESSLGGDHLQFKFDILNCSTSGSVTTFVVRTNYTGIITFREYWSSSNIPSTQYGDDGHTCIGVTAGVNTQFTLANTSGVSNAKYFRLWAYYGTNDQITSTNMKLLPSRQWSVSDNKMIN